MASIVRRNEIQTETLLSSAARVNINADALRQFPCQIPDLGT